MSSSVLYRNDKQQDYSPADGPTKRFAYSPLSFTDRFTRESGAASEFKEERVETPQFNAATSFEKYGRKKKKGRPINRFFLFITVILSVVLVAEIVFNFIIAPKLVIREIEIKADSTIHLSNKQIMDIAGIDKQLYYYRVNSREITARLEENPVIKQAEVRKNFPDGLTVTLIGRKPLAIALVETDDATVPVSLDREGIVFQIGESVTDYTLPVISGIAFSEVRLGMKIPAVLVPFLRKIEALQQKEPELLRVISEFRFVRKSSPDYEVIMYPREYTIPVRIGADIDEQLIKYLLMVLDVVSRDPSADMIEEIDFRTNEIVYRFKEG
jgi:cell division protein FtsQ